VNGSRLEVVLVLAIFYLASNSFLVFIRLLHRLRVRIHFYKEYHSFLRLILCAWTELVGGGLIWLWYLAHFIAMVFSSCEIQMTRAVPRHCGHLAWSPVLIIFTAPKN